MAGSGALAATQTGTPIAGRQARAPRIGRGFSGLFIKSAPISRSRCRFVVHHCPPQPSRVDAKSPCASANPDWASSDETRLRAGLGLAVDEKVDKLVIERDQPGDWYRLADGGIVTPGKI